MQSTPTKKQATSSNGLSYTTPERRRVLDPNDTRGSMALATPEELKAQLASRPRSVRSGEALALSIASFLVWLTDAFALLALSFFFFLHRCASRLCSSRIQPFLKAIHSHQEHLCEHSLNYSRLYI